MNTRSAERLSESRGRAREPEKVLRRRLLAPLAILAVGALPHVAFADPPLAADEVRHRRWVHDEHPLWREALALPNDALLLLSWPVEQLLCWAERLRLGTRVHDVVLAPTRSPESREQ